MPRIRSLKPDFITSPSTRRLSREARLFFILLLTDSDDEGRIVAGHKRLAGVLFPHDDDVRPAKIKRWLDECEAQEMIRRYSAEGTDYLLIVNFTKHQRISHPTASHLPPPPLRKHSGEIPEPPPNGSGVTAESFRPDLGVGEGEGSSSSSAEGGSGDLPEGVDDDDPELEAEIERRLKAVRASGRSVPYPKAWKSKARENLRAEIARDGRAAALAPAPSKPLDEAEKTSAAHRAIADRNEAYARGEGCATCEGHGRVFDDEGDVASPCPACTPERLKAVGQ